MNVPPIDPEILKSSRRMVKAQKRRARRQWLAENALNLFNSLIALVALIVAILGLYLPKS